MSLRTPLQYVGGSAILLGLVVVVAGVGNSVSASAEFVLLTVIGVLGTLVGVGILHHSGGDLGEWWRPTDTEPGHRVPVPGDELAGERESVIEDRIRERVVASLVEARGCSTAEAERLVESGAWTDDGLAAAYLDDRGFSAISRFLAYLRGESLTEAARERVMEELRHVRGDA